MSEAEVMAAARGDPDAQPRSVAQLARMKHTPRAKLIRRALGLTQEEFATRFHIQAQASRIKQPAPISP
jgi:putative transcriptional regulator